MNRRKLTIDALQGTLAVRQQLGIDASVPVNVFEIARQLEVDVWLKDIPSMEGMFSRDRNAIVLPTSRPPGRRNFSCGHELGHWHFGHGTQIDDLDSIEEDGNNEEEFLVNQFSASLLMPKWAVAKAFKRRNVSAQDASPKSIYSVSCQLGVGYESLIHQMSINLKLITRPRASVLLKTKPKSVKNEIWGMIDRQQLMLVDSLWERVPIDLEIGWLAVLPQGAVFENECVKVIAECSDGLVAEAARPGICQCVSEESNWAGFIRVSRSRYTGREQFRFLDDPDYE